jgi:RND family efflux transporter MFP subunit
MAPIIWYPGSVISRKDSRVAAEREGRLIWVAEVGTQVQAGMPLARLNDSLVQQNLAVRRAAVEREQARQEYFAGELKRLEQLKLRDYANQSRLDEVHKDLLVSRSELAAARARVRAADELLKRSQVAAPFAGVVTERLAQAGEWADEGKALVRLVDNLSLEVQTWVPVTTLSFIGLETVLDLRAGEQLFQGVVRTIIPVGDDLSRLYELRLGLDGSSWLAGLSIRVGVPSAKAREVVAIPRDALVLRRGGSSVFRILDDDTAEQVAVTTGIAIGPYIEVVSKIRPGDRVVVRGGERLRPGQQVQVLAPRESL